MRNIEPFERLTKAVERALPVIVDMFDNFPYAELEGDDEIMTELRNANKAAKIHLLEGL